MESKPRISGVRLAGRSDIGKVREENQDSLVLRTPDEPSVRRSSGSLLAVADGMGGLEGGRIASRLAIEHLVDAYYAGDGDPAERLEGAALAANRVIYRYSVEKAAGQAMGSTLTALAILEDRVCIAQVGDSRAYLYRDGSIRQVTRDHSLLRELQDRGEIEADLETYQCHRNVLTRALGLRQSVEIDLFELEDVRDGDLFLVSSDGFHELVTEGEMVQAIRDHEEDLDALCGHYVEIARERGGPDNITVGVARLGPTDPPVRLVDGDGAAESEPDTSPVASEDPGRRPPGFLPLAIFVSFLAGAACVLLLEQVPREAVGPRAEVRRMLDELAPLQRLEGEDLDRLRVRLRKLLGQTSDPAGGETDDG